MKPEQVPIAAYVAHRVDKWREENGGISQREAAAKIGVSAPLLGRYRAGQGAPDGETLAKLGAFLGDPDIRRSALEWWENEGRDANPGLARMAVGDTAAVAAYVVHRADEWVSADPLRRTLLTFAAMAGIPRSALSQWRKLRGSPDPTSLARVAAFLGTTPDELRAAADAWWGTHGRDVSRDGMPPALRPVATVGGVPDHEWATMREQAFRLAQEIPVEARAAMIERARKAELVVILGGKPNAQDVADIAEALYRVFERSGRNG